MEQCLPFSKSYNLTLFERRLCSVTNSTFGTIVPKKGLMWSSFSIRLIASCISCKCRLNTKIVLLIKKKYNSIISSKLDSKTFVATALFLLTSFIFLDLQSSFTQFHLVFFPSCLVWQNVLLSLLKFHFTKKFTCLFVHFCKNLE